MLSLWKPFNQFDRLNREFDQHFFGKLADAQVFSPAVDVEEDDEQFVLRADLPGLNKKDIAIEIHEGVLTLSGKREDSREESKDNAVYRERRYGSFSRRFRLADVVDAEKITATFSDGVLTVVLPKAERAKPRQIPVTNN